MMSFPLWFQPPDYLSHMPKNSPILVGFSGGADSCVLLWLLKKYSEQNGTPLFAAHVNHGIRGEEALRDRDFCADMAKRLGVHFFTESFDVPSMVGAGDSLEGVGRRVRYEWFSELMREHNIPLLALAHHADDNLETVIFNLVRGSGSNGMCGILPARSMDGVPEGLVIRPLIRAEKREILDFCRDNGIEYVTDSTNGEDNCSRNIIRHRIIPELEALRAHPQRSASRMTELISEDNDALNEIAENKLAGRCEIPVAELNSYRPAIAGRIVRMLCKSVIREIPHETVRQILEFSRQGRNNSEIDLPDNAVAVIEYGLLTVKRRTVRNLPICVDLTDGFFNLGNGIAIFVSKNMQSPDIYGDFLRVSSADIDRNAISGRLFASERHDGDTINTMGMTKSLRKLFSERKIPRELRSSLPIVHDENGILLVPGCAVRSGAKRTEGRDYINISLYFNRTVRNTAIELRSDKSN